MKSSSHLQQDLVWHKILARIAAQSLTVLNGFQPLKVWFQPLTLQLNRLQSQVIRKLKQAHIRFSFVHQLSMNPKLLNSNRFSKR